MDSGLSYSDIKDIINVSYSRQNKHLPYCVSRDLTGERNSRQSNYLNNLPKYGELNVLDIFNLGLKENESYSVCDVGCGECGFLLSLSELYQSSSLANKRELNLHGISAYNYHNDLELRKTGVQVQIGDFQRFKFNQKYNLITAMHSIRYMANPLGIIKKIYNALEFGGVSLIYPIEIYFGDCGDDQNGLDSLLNYLIDRYNFEISPGKLTSSFSMSFKKNYNNLYLPVRPKFVIDKSGNLENHSIGLSYEWVGSEYR